MLYENELKESLKVNQIDTEDAFHAIFIMQAPGFENWNYTVENVDGALHVRFFICYFTFLNNVFQVRHQGKDLEKKD